MVKTVERVVRMVPVVKDLLPANKDGLNSLIQPESTSQVAKLNDIIHNKNAEIFNLRQERKDMKRVLFSNNKKIKDLEENLENCAYELNILNNAINNTGG
jgi:chromosome segregation ATPase